MFLIYLFQNLNKIYHEKIYHEMWNWGFWEILRLLSLTTSS